MIKLTVNGTSRDVDVDADTPLLWVLREWLGMTGTKYGCGIAQCGACTVHLDGVATRSCQVPVGTVGEAKITTIEGLSTDGLSHPVQVAWLHHDVPQCGYCQSGQIMAAAALLTDEPEALGCRHRRCDHQHLSLRHLSAHPRGDPYRCLARRQGIGSRTMSNRLALRRRSFLGSVAAVGGGLALGWRIPVGAASAESSAQELGIWVVISPDDTTVVRIARSEMGQGTFTGLAQLVADELDADWKYVRAEYVSPDANLASKRAWGDMSTGGSRGIRGSVDYVRKGGAAARAMLIEAAAQRWNVPATRMHGGEQRDHPRVERPDAALRRGRRRCGEAAGADRGEAEDAGAVDDHRQGREAAGHGREAVRQAGIRDRRAVARHAECGDRAMPGVRRHAEILRCRQDQIDARRAAGRRGGQQRGRGGGRQVVPGEDRARRVADRVGRGRRRHRGQRADRGPAEGRPRREGGGARPEARRCGGGARRRGEGGARRCTPRRSSPTPRWSR